MNDIAADFRRAALGYGLVLVVIVAAVSVAISRQFQRGADIQSLRDTIRIADTVAITRTDTVIVRQRAVTRFDTLVRNITDTQVVIQREPFAVPETLTVDSLLVQRDRAKDALILGLYQRDSTRLWQIASRDKLIRALEKEPRFEKWAGIGYDPIEKYGSVTVGASLNIWRGIGADLYIDQPLIRGERPYTRLLIGYWRTF